MISGGDPCEKLISLVSLMATVCSQTQWVVKKIQYNTCEPISVRYQICFVMKCRSLNDKSYLLLLSNTYKRDHCFVVIYHEYSILLFYPFFLPSLHIVIVCCNYYEEDVLMNLKETNE